MSTNGVHTNPSQGGGGPPAAEEMQKRLQEARLQQELLETELRVKRLQHASRLLGLRQGSRARAGQAELDVQESDALPLDGWGSFVDPRDAFGDLDLLNPVPTLYSRVTDRRKGRNWPLWRTWADLSRLRQASRILCQTNGQVKGLIKNLINYLIGKGLGYKATVKKRLPRGVSPDDADLTREMFQNWIDNWRKRNSWQRRERENLRRVRRDGEAFNRLFLHDDGTSDVRFVEPEQVYPGPDQREEEGWTFGIQHQMQPFEDVTVPVNYWVVYSSDPGRGERVAAGDLVHIKNLDEDSTVKRGLPDFTWDVLEAFNRAAKLQRNISEGAAIQAAIATIEQFETATQQDITDMQGLLTDYQRTDPQTARNWNTQKWEPGTQLKIPKGQSYVPPPFAQGEGTHLEVVQGDLRMGVAAFCAPEYFTADASNADYSSTKEAGAPFVKCAETDQEHFKACFLEILLRCVWHAIRCGKLPENTMLVCEIQIEAPAVLHKDLLQTVQADTGMIQAGYKSRQTAALGQGLDWDQERANMEEYQDEFGRPSGPLPLPGDQGGLNQGGP